MIDTRKVSRDIQDRIADQVRKSQEGMSGAIRAWMDAAQSLRSQLPEMPQALQPKIPGRDALVANAHDVAEQIRVAQRQWYGQAREAYGPLTHELRKARKDYAAQIRQAYAPLNDELRKVAMPLTDELRKVAMPLTDQVRKAAAPLACQARKVVAPLADGAAEAAHAHPQASQAPVTPAHAAAAKTAAAAKRTPTTKK